MKADHLYHNLQFKTPSGTSRGILKTKPSWFLKYSQTSSDKYAIGECSIIKGLSPENLEVLPKKISQLCTRVNSQEKIEASFFEGFPALKFAHEMATKDLESNCQRKLFETEFLAQKGIPINGLVWMGPKDYMKKQIVEKIASGFKCIKIKIAAIDFEEELSLLSFIRSEFSSEDLEIRVDANGGFSTDTALDKLKRLSEFKLHSIEQPIMAGQYDEMNALCVSSPLAIALDEELIGLESLEQKRKVLEVIQPQYIILKPSLVGGFAASEEWIKIAKTNNIGWWVTSALESNIGLNAIAQWTATLDSPMYQGLGTGQLFTNNIPSPLEIQNGHLYHSEKNWDESIFNTVG